MFCTFSAFTSRVNAQVDEKPAEQALEVDQDEPPVLVPGEKPPSTLIEISDEPTTIDPSTVLPEQLTKRVTVSFNEKPLKDVVKWLQDEQRLNVLLDEKALSDEGILIGEPITDHLNDQPIYFLLNRLKSVMLDWYFEDETLFVTTKTAASEHTYTASYNLSLLLDSGYKSQSLINTTYHALPGVWEENDGNGGAIVLLGDILFVRQTFRVQNEFQSFLMALQKHGRRTYSFYPKGHEALRNQKLFERVSVIFNETPLNSAIRELSRLTGTDIRLDLNSLKDEGISERIPITLKLNNLPFKEVLRAISQKHQLTWHLQDEILWITTSAVADEQLVTAFFDVRDLCRSTRESNALMEALRMQTRGNWEEVDGSGGMLSCPKTGVLVVRQTEKTMDEILKLLEAYRGALRSSKFREPAEADRKEVITKYYRLQKDIAKDVVEILPEFVKPETWQSEKFPDATGTIGMVASKSSLLRGIESDPAVKPLMDHVVAYSVLIIRQTREVHEEIDNVLNKIQYGDAGDVLRTTSGNPIGSVGGGGYLNGAAVGGGGGMGGGIGGGGMGGGGMGGGGGFGGGYFSIPKQ